MRTMRFDHGWLVIWMVAITSAPALAAEELDLSYVGRDAIAAAVVHPHQLLTDPRYEYFPSEIVIAACQENFGIDPTGIDLAIATVALQGALEGKPNFGVILHFRDSIDQESLMQRIGNSAVERSLEDQKYWELAGGMPTPLCLAIPNEKVLLIATKTHLENMLTANDVNTPLTKLLRAADVSKSLVVVLNFSAVRPLLLLGMQQIGEMPPEFAPFLEIPKLLKSIEARLELNPFSFELVFGADDAADAARFTELLAQAKQMATSMFEQQMSALTAGDDSPTAQATAKYMQRISKAMLDAIEVTTNEDKVSITTSGEMMPAIASSGVLAALLLPAVQSAREAARRAQAVNELKQIGLALHNYHDAQKAFPPQAIRDPQGRPLLSWRVAILPFLEQQELYNQFHLDEPWDSEHNIKLLERMPKVFANPNLASTDQTVFLAVQGEDTVFAAESSAKIKDIMDGTSNTILVVEADADRAVPWTKPEDLNFDADAPLQGLGHLRPGGFSALFGDGHVQFIGNSIDPAVLRALMTKSGREPIRLP